MGKNKWFKHFNDASTGNSLSLLWDSGDLESYGFWWRLLELVSRWEKDDARGRVVLSWGILRRELSWNRQRSSKVLSKIAQTFQVQVTPLSDETFEVFIPNWAKFQEHRGGKREAKKEQTSGRGKKKEERGKNKEQNANSSHPLFEIWNQNRGPLPEAKKLTAKRKLKAESRWSEEPSTEYWTEVVVRMARSSFCRGEKNDPTGDHANWKADFDFMLAPETHVKVTEGKYDDRAASQAPTKVYSLEDLKAMKL